MRSNATRAPAASPARLCAYQVVRRVFEQGAYTDRALTSEAAGLEPRDRALAMTLAYGTVQRKATLDHVAGKLVRRPIGQLEPAVLAAIRLGLFQLLYLKGVADYAAVSESVELAKAASPASAGLVNAVLRRAASEGPAILAELDDSTPEAAALLHSAPTWLATLWWRELGAQTAAEQLRRINDPAESAIRVNTLVSTPDDVARELPVPNHPAPEIAEGLVLEAPFDAHGSDLFARGAIMPQSRGSMLVARMLAPEPASRVLDLCAAPGGKTTHLAALMEDRGRVTAVERHQGRAHALQRTCARMHCSCITVETADAATPRQDGPFDAVLVDPPCSGLGTLQSRPDLRWRVTPEAITDLKILQARILRAGAAATRPGGALVYSVCTISREEGADLIDSFLKDHPEWRYAGDPIQLLPARDGTDGFFIAKLRR